MDGSSSQRQDARVISVMLGLAALGCVLVIAHRFSIGFLRVTELALISAGAPVLLGLAVALWRSAKLLDPIVRTLGLIGAGYLLTRSLHAGLAASSATELRVDLSHCAAWAPVVWLLLMQGFDRRRARVLSLTVYVGLIFSTTVGLRGPYRDEIPAIERFTMAEWFVLAGGLFLMFLELSANARERAGHAESAFKEARTDSLTGLANRRGMEEQLGRELDRAGERPAAMALILVDIDHFKRINDQHGHPAGDEVLRRVAALLDVGVRTTDLVGRWGGEEFLILLRRTDLQAASALAERLRQSLADSLFPGIGRVTASFGIAAPAEGDSVVAAVARADEALYEAKEGGRNRAVTSYSSLPAIS